MLVSCGGGSSGGCGVVENPDEDSTDTSTDTDNSDTGIDNTTQGKFAITRSLFSLDLISDERRS